VTSDTLDGIARSFGAAPSRRAFLLQLGGIALSAAFGRVGLRLPAWAAPRHHPQCHPEREGVDCGECGICQNGQCIGYADAKCRNTFGILMVAGETAARCRRCVRGSGLCTPCAKGQKCCSDGCCDGDCTADGACCPPAKVCGEQCCRDCEVCRNGVCQLKGEGQTVCPPNYTLITMPTPDARGCCVCQRGLCGDQCCAEDETCLDGKCCKQCGLDRAICCDDLICCRERCQTPSEPCCPCREDISPEEGQEILDRARAAAKEITDKGTKYALGKMDCSKFCAISLADRSSKGDGLTTRNLDGNCDFRRLKSGEKPRAGDVLAQPRSSGPPGSQHQGIAEGQPGGNGGQRGMQMGGGGARSGVWGVGPSDGGWFEGAYDLAVYRPQKRKEPCKQ
jgi:hypothetical protein